MTIVARVPLPPDHEWRKTHHNTKWPNPWALYHKDELVRAASRFEIELLDAKVNLERTGDPTGRDPRPLAHIEGDEIVIRLSVDALVHATEHHPSFYDDDGKPTVKVVDRDAWVASFLSKLNEESEVGDTPIMRLFDRSAWKAVDDGEEGVEVRES